MEIFGLFRRKKKEIPIEDMPLPDLPKEPAKPQDVPQADVANLKAKLDLILTELDSLKTMNQMVNERLKAMEKKLTESESKGIRYY